VSGVTQIPGAYAPPVVETAAAAPTWSTVPPSTPVESARPVEPVASADFQPTDLAGETLANAMVFTAIAAMVREAGRETGQQAEVSGEAAEAAQAAAVAATAEAAPVQLAQARVVGNQVRQFEAALAESGSQALSEEQMLGALRRLQPQPNPQPNLPGNVERLAAVVRQQILQDYRIAFMVHGRLTPAVAQLLF